MKLEIEVKRIRVSVTQGYAHVYVNGEKAITFEDKIEIIPEGGTYYGEMISGWASVTSDSSFINGLLWHKYDYIYKHSKKVKEVLEKGKEGDARKNKSRVD